MTARAVRLKTSLKRLARRCGLDVRLYRARNSAPARRARLLSELGVGLVLDVGANTGQYARELRLSGYHGRIVSFEPLSEPFIELAKAAGPDGLWDCVNVALGAETGEVLINVAANYSSSSVLPWKDRNLASAPETAYVGTETVRMTTLDALRDELLRPRGPVFLKADVQGYELAVLRGAEATLPAVGALEIELSFEPLYDGQPLFREVIDHLESQGFSLFSLEPAFADHESGRTLQMDAIFVR